VVFQPSNNIEFSGERKRVRCNEGLGALSGTYLRLSQMMLEPRIRQSGEKMRVSQRANVVPRTRLKKPTRLKSPTARAMNKTPSRRVGQTKSEVPSAPATSPTRARTSSAATNNAAATLRVMSADG